VKDQSFDSIVVQTNKPEKMVKIQREGIESSNSYLFGYASGTDIFILGCNW